MNGYEILSKFDYEGNTYIIFIKDRKKILFSKIIENNISLILTDKEYKLLNKIYSNLKINSEKSILVDNKIINNNSYDIYYDKTTENHFWKDLNNPLDNIILNYRYNNMQTTFYTNNINQEKNKTTFYKKVIKIGHKLIPILLSATISLSILSGCTLLDSQQKKIDKIEQIAYTQTVETKQTEQQESNKEIQENIDETGLEEQQIYNYEDIKNAIENNPNLTQEEKDFLLKLQFIFDENNQYMDLELIKERLSNLKIEYNKKGEENFKKIVGGYYNSETNLIEMENVKNFEETDLRVFLHEFLHVLQINPYRYLAELSNEAFTRETLRRMCDEGLLEKEQFHDYTTDAELYGIAYSNDIFIYEAMKELLDEETLREYQFSCKDKAIENGLNDMKKSYILLNSIDRLREYDYKNNMMITNESETARSKMLNDLNHFYVQKKGITVQEDLEIVSQSKHVDELSEEAFEKTVLDYLYEDYGNVIFGSYRIISSKSYLSNDYNTVKITFNIDKDEYVTIEINEEIANQYLRNYHHLENQSARSK